MQPEIHYRVHKNPPQVAILSEINPVHILTVSVHVKLKHKNYSSTPLVYLYEPLSLALTRKNTEKLQVVFVLRGYEVTRDQK
jgi:hypothetical protein